MSFKNKLFLLPLLLFLILSCEYKSSVTPTRGKTHILISEDIEPVILKEIAEFERYYNEAKITHTIVPTREAVVQLLNDSVKIIAIPRELNKEEWKVIKTHKLYIDTFKIAYDGIAILGNKKNKVENLTLQDLIKILNGEQKVWKNGEKIIIATGSSNSAIYEYFQNELLHNSKIGAIIYPCTTSTQVVELVKKNENVLGFIGSSWLSEATEKCKVIKIGNVNFRRDSTSGFEYFTPHAAHIYRNYYPLKRSLYLVGRNLSGGVEDGFITFVSSVNGQKIFVNNNLAPATMPVRLISLTSEKE